MEFLPALVGERADGEEDNACLYLGHTNYSNAYGEGTKKESDGGKAWNRKGQEKRKKMIKLQLSNSLDAVKGQFRMIKRKKSAKGKSHLS